ncbi:MAG: PGPGW domain-containing protein [Nocardioides sp.]
MSRTVRRVLLFVAGLVLIVTGLVLIVLPGPLTIPPVLAGLWLWSLEFEFARHWLRPVRARGADAWALAKEKPVHTTVVTVLGLAGAGLIIWAVLRYDLLDRGWELVGLG